MSQNPLDQRAAGGNLLPPPSQAEVGKKVSVRLFEEPAAGGGFRDLLGILESPTQVRKKDGTLHDFDPEKIFLWKVVPVA